MSRSGSPGPAGDPPMTRTAGSTRGRLAPAAGALLVALLAAFVLVSLAARQLSPGDVWSASPLLVLVVAAAAVGTVVARHQPRNPIGWILLGIAACFLLSTDAGRYAVADYRLRHGDLPLGQVAVLLSPLWTLAVVAFPLVILLFPDGRLASPRWRWVLRAYLVVGACWPLSLYAVTIRAIAEHSIRILPSGDLSVIDFPAGTDAWLATAQGAVLPLLLAFWAAFLVRQVLSWRRAGGGERRQQLKWLMSGAAVCLVTGAPTILFGSGTPNPNIPAVAQWVLNLLSFGIAALPAGIGVGILKYRLYEIDRLISRTLAYALVTGLLVALYAGLVLLATQVLSFSSPVAVAASTLAAAALFSPVRRRVQRVVDRRFNRARYDADQTVAAFAAALKDAVDLDTVRADLLDAVHRSLEPAHASVWFGSG
jgi:hypothetical protein